MKKAVWILLLLLLLIPGVHALAETDIYTLVDAEGNVVTRFCGECEAGDEYISGDNKHYRVTEIQKENQTATVEYLGEADMPDVSWLDMASSQPVSAVGSKKIALYCTHSDESYIEGDGTESVDGRGGIYDVAGQFGEALEKLGVTVEISDETHLPHDAGAYRRSRSTAVSLLKGQPNAIFDIHRDGIPDPDEYVTRVGNKDMSKVRLLVGKSNQNKDANLSFAKQIKAVGDQVYPGLIKDIYMGKGTYNQDLAPRSVLLEFGTHTISKERVLASTQPMSEVVYKALFGGISGSAGASDVSRGASKAETENAPEAAPPAVEDNTGSGWALWLIIGLVVVLGVFAFLSTGGKGGASKFGRSFSEMTGGLFGKKPKDR